MEKNILIVQPGRFGDIIICLPIAKYYADLGYKVDWFCQEPYDSLFRNINYCTPVKNIEKHYYDVIDMSFGFGGPPEGWWQITKPRWKSFVEAKYFLAHTPLEEKWNLQWERDLKAENKLFDELNLPQEYLVYHDEGSQGAYDLELPEKLHRVKFGKFKDYNIFDWYKVLEQAKEIHCVDSVLCNFVDAALKEKKEKFFHDIRQHSSSPDRTLLKDWRTINYEN